jgi:hypothetical protein
MIWINGKVDPLRLAPIVLTFEQCFFAFIVHIVLSAGDCFPDICQILGFDEAMLSSGEKR